MGAAIRGSSDAVAGIGRRPAPPARRRRFHVWSVVAVAVTLACYGAAVAGARFVARSNEAKSAATFKRSATDIASTVRLALQREQDLEVTAAAFFLGDPQASDVQFRAWSTSIQALKRFPELVNWGEIVVVPASRLSAFAARYVAGSSGATPGAAGAFTPIPTGARPYYCLVAALQHTPAQQALPAAVDYCAGSSLIASRDTGQILYTAVDLGNGNVMAVNAPFYRGGGVPATVSARRAAFAGWIGISFDPRVALAAALPGHLGTAVALRFHDAGTGAFAASDAVFRAGTRPPNATTATVNIGNGWTVETFGRAASGGLFGNSSALIVLIGGLVLSLVVGVLVFVLGTGRARAMTLVAERTGELRYQALHDPLTGLPNRALIMDRIGQLLARARRSGNDGAVLYVDLDEFKNVNDTLGHAAGDQLLVAAAARLKGTLRDTDTIGRMGGDEFVVLIDGGDLKDGPEIVADRLLDAMHRPFELDGAAVPMIVNTSIGIAAGDRGSAGELLRDADVALYQAKANGKDCRHSFDADQEAADSHRTELAFDLRSALEAKQFRLVYQPIYKLSDLSLIGVEALLRWQHPTMGQLPPDEFIPILERTGQIREVGRWVLQEACTQMAVWHARGHVLDISVNVAAAQLDSDAIIEHVREALASSGLHAGSLILEVTETALMRNANATSRRLQAIKDLGVRIAVDDFGTGYSSLGRLQQFPVDSLKIDRLFTSAITTSPYARAVITTVTQLANELGLATLAEGVETGEQLDHLRAEKIDEIQGFLLSRPLPPEALERQVLAPLSPARPAPRAVVAQPR